MTHVIHALPAGEPDQTHPSARVVVADAPDSYPCRRCLTDARVGERLLLLPYDPFPQSGPYTGAGPIFVHADGCQGFRFTGEVPGQLRRRLLALRAYDQACMMTSAEVVEGGELEGALGEAFAAADTAFVHLHYARPGCFACRVDRAPAA
jgi:hypothetical protein